MKVYKMTSKSAADLPLAVFGSNETDKNEYQLKDWLAFEIDTIRCFLFILYVPTAKLIFRK